ncbi:hypothetical protein GCM10011505_49960 [Tistrella bauzanensis]|uniref:Uncharacterized protein n=1 Tax=Tistrella bauzanensis TaxID=657419 RepID=A0ABQ1JDB5_9PROT|nr:hypothetical protein GCM10011505_49960 [Tistrella bauzanensis]
MLGALMVAGGALAAEATPPKDAVMAEPGPQAASQRGMSCVGEEPFWSLDIGMTEAKLSRPGADGIDETVLTGQLQSLDFLDPPIHSFRGVPEDAPDQVLVATMVREICASTMSDQTPDRPWRAVISFPDGSLATGCCKPAGEVQAVLDPTAGPAERAEDEAGADEASHSDDSPVDDSPADGSPVGGRSADGSPAHENWARDLASLMPAIRACVADGRVPVQAVTAARVMNEGLIGVRLRAPDGSRHDCITSDAKVSAIDPVPEDAADTWPGEGDPLFLPAGDQPPTAACGTVERVLDGDGQLVGYLHAAPCG